MEQALNKPVVSRIATEIGLEMLPTLVLDRDQLLCRRRELDYTIVLKPERTKIMNGSGAL